MARGVENQGWPRQSQWPGEHRLDPGARELLKEYYRRQRPEEESPEAQFDPSTVLALKALEDKITPDPNSGHGGDNFNSDLLDKEA